VGEQDQETKSSRPGGWWRRLDTWQQLVSIAAGLAGVAGTLIALGVIEGSDDPESPPTPAPAESEEIPRYEGVAGHLAEGTALIDFLEQHDRETVLLDVSFPNHFNTGGADNVYTEDVGSESGTFPPISSIELMTECDPEGPLPENPTVSDGCMGVSLSIQGDQTEDSYTTFLHGAPLITGYYTVDVTDYLQMGISPILLKPLTYEEATSA
jgi:hypothetical protein